MSDEHFPTVGEANDHNVSKIEGMSIVVDLLKLIVSTRVVSHIV